MRKFSMFLIIVLASAICSGVAFAQDASVISGAFDKLPGLKQGVAFSLMDSKLNYLTTIDIINWKGINLEAGYSADAEKTGHKAVAVVSYDLWNAKKAGVTVPVLDLINIRPGAYIGYGRIEGFQDGGLKGAMDLGLSVTAIEVKF